MNEQRKKTDQTLLALGIAITLPMILASGPLAGYVIGRFLFVKYLHTPSWTIPVFVGLGFLASGLQSYRLIKRLKDLESKKT